MPLGSRCSRLLGGSILATQDQSKGKACTHSTEALAAGVNALPAGLMLGAFHKEYVCRKNAFKAIPRASKDLRQQARQQINQQAGLLAASQIASIPVSAELAAFLEEAFLI
jgi:hypothetical protein